MNELKKGDEIFVDIKRVGINGEGIAFYKKLAIFIPDALPKENILVEITDVNKKYATAKIKKIKVKSDLRCNTLCPYINKCGGCSLQHLEYQKSGSIKKDILIEALNRYSGLNPRSFEIFEPNIMNNPIGYRFKATLPLRQGEHGVVWGLYAPNSEKFIRVKECLVHAPIINEVANSVCEILSKLNINAYDLKNKKGYVRYLIIRSSHCSLDTQITFIFNELPKDLSLLGQECLKINNVKSIYYSLNMDEENVEFFGEKVIKLAGTDYIVEELDGKKYQLLPSSFFQLNPNQAEVLYNLALKRAKLSKKEVLVDAFCGVGTISLTMAKLAKEVIGIENNHSAILNAKENALTNNISNVKFIEGNASNVLPYVTKNNAVDVLVVDPPRSGLDDEFVKALLKAEIKKIIYISCNPATLAKNLSLLKDKYIVKTMDIVDMFPFTGHVEAIVGLYRKESK